MAKIKFSIELEENIYKSIKKQFEEQKSIFGKYCSNVNEFIENILITFVKSGEEMKNMEGKMADLIKSFGDSLGGFDLNNIFDSFNKKQSKKDEKENKKDDKGLKS